MAVHFKFRSAVNYDSIAVEGNCISVASLKGKIVEQKNLGKGTDFDLVIANAETGEEYAEDNFLVPKNTSVIIKRVPARRAKTTLLVHDRLLDLKEQCSNVNMDSEGTGTVRDFPTTVDELYDMDDFGVDLYAVDDSALTHVEADDYSNTTEAAVGTMADSADGMRLPQENDATYQVTERSSFGRGLAKGHNYAVPPPGYICHRCGQPEHFIQHCPTNGDPAFDMKRGFRSRDPERSGILGHGLPAAQYSERTTLSKEVEPLPPELRCPLCQGIFKEAVMVPCCHYSFCDKCIRQDFLEKKKCPQCGSAKLKNDDLLPNIALRQAIDRFTESQLHVLTRDEGTSKAVVGDMESATKVLASSPLGNVDDLCKSSIYLANQDAVENGSSLPTIVADSVCESAVGSKERSVVEGNKISTQATDLSVASKKKKKHFRTLPADGQSCELNSWKPRKMDRLCYLCGSPDHLARHCNVNSVDNTVQYGQHRGMGMFRPVGPVPPTMTPYGQDMYWPGRPMLHVRPLRVGYGDGLCPAIPFDTPVIPVGSYGVASYVPPIYPNPPMHGGFFSSINNSGMMVPRERPLSREEFMELQERERRRRLTQERQERELIGAIPQTINGVQSLPSELELSQRPSIEKCGGLSRRCGFEQRNAAPLSDNEVDHGKIKSKSKSKIKHIQRQLSERLEEHALHHLAVSVPDDDSKALRSRAERWQRSEKIVIPSETRRLSKYHQLSIVESESSEGEDVERKSFNKIRASREEGVLGKQSSSSKFDAFSSEKHDWGGSTFKYDENRRLHVEPSVGEVSHVHHHHHHHRYRSKKAASDSSKHILLPSNEGSKLVHSGHHDEESIENITSRHYHHHLTELELTHQGCDPQERNIKKNNQSQINSQSEMGGIVVRSSEDELNRKRKRKKYKSEGTRNVFSNAIEDSIVESGNQKKKISNHSVKFKNTVKNKVEERWQMADALFADEDSIPERKWFKHRLRHSHDASD